jgi:hypothetical protein
MPDSAIGRFKRAAYPGGVHATQAQLCDHSERASAGVGRSLRSGSRVRARRNPNSKLVYTEQIVSGNLVVAFDESGQKRLLTVGYALDANVTREVDCGGGLIVIEQRSVSNSDTGLLPDDKGRVTGELVLDPAWGPSGCVQTIVRRIDYMDVTLTNLTSGHAYRLDPISQTFTT